jgi:hypothetical protein
MIDGRDYLDRFVGINLEFELALRALDGFKGSEDAIRKYANEELASLQTIIGGAQIAGFSPEKHWAFSPEGSGKFLDSVRAGLPSMLEQVVNRLRQNKLVLRVTHLESALKDVHREVLRSNPQLLRSDRQIPLGKLVSQPIQDILDEEIEREVQSMDRKTLEQRAEYFDTRLNITWFDGTIVPLMKPLFDLRNKVIHGDSVTCVSKGDLLLADTVCMALLWCCILQAAVLYPNSFKWGDTETEGMKGIMKQQGRIS